MGSAAADAITRLVRAGWSVDPTPPPGTELPSALAGASEVLTAWVSSFSALSSPDDAVWFLSRNDYAAQPADEFAWNAFETLSLEAAGTAREAAEISEYWRAHRPILLSVRDHYAYLAERSNGAIVHGSEPEFEESTVVAANLGELLDSLADRTPGLHYLVVQLLFDR